MPQEKIIIKFEAKDADKLIKAINRLTAAQKNLQKGIVTTTGATSGATAANGKLAKSQHLVDQRMSGNAKTANILQGAFATLRNKLLLLSFATVMVVKPLLALIKAQSDAEEIANKFNVVFGRQADVVRDWAGTFGQSVGRASSELQGMLATLQDTFVPLGFARKEATKLSISLTTLALDVASFNNKLDADVIRDFQSALVGNHETVRKYGIVITEAQLAAEALRSGIIETKRELTSQEKVQARLNLIISGSKDAIGDLERTQESYANTLKRFNAEVRVTQEELGKALIPLATELLGVMTNLVIHFRDTDAIRNYALFLGGVALSMSGVTAATFSLAGAFGVLRTAMIRSGWGIAIASLGYLADKFIFADDAVEEFNEDIDANAIMAKRAEDRIADLAQEIDTYESSLVDANEAVITQEEKLKQWIGTMNLANSTINSFASISARLSKTSIENASLTVMGTTANKDYVAMETLKVKQSEEMRIAEQKLLMVKQQHHHASDIEKMSLAFTISELENKILTYGKLHPMEVDNLVMTQRLAEAVKEKSEADKIRKALVTEELKDMKAELGLIGDLEKAEKSAMDVSQERVGLDLFKADIQRAETLIAEEAAMQKVVRSEEELNAILGIGISAYARTEEGQRALIQAEMDIIVANSAMLEGFIDVDVALLKLLEDYKNVGLVIEEELTARETLIGKLDEEKQKRLEVAQAALEIGGEMLGQFNNMTSAMSAGVNARMKNEMDALKATSTYQRADGDKRKAMEKGVTDSYAKERTRLAKFEKASNLAQAGINIAQAITRVLPNVFLAALVGAMGSVQIGAILSTPIPKFATGGRIVGRRHSQGGTMIEAEAGEFVMSRSAVESVGIENLNRMNEGGGGGAVTVNVSGNVLSQDFVEGELAENIKEAIRRGTDFGIS